jgi:hypothetical protein
MKYITFKFALILALLSTLVGCNLEKEVEIELPAYERQYVVECYLEPGKPYNLLLTKSSSYFDSISLDPAAYLKDLLADKAVVTVTHDGVVHELKETLYLDPATGKFANYASADKVPLDTDKDFTLKIVTKEGKEINAVTKILPKVLIDSVVTEFQDTFARVLTYLTDNQSTANYYRRTLNFGSLDSIPLQDFATDDKLATTAKFAFGTGYDYVKGDTIFNTIYHMSKEYFEFFRTINIAKASNGNIIAQPSTIKSNVKGSANPIGIFTGLSYDQKMTIIK